MKRVFTIEELDCAHCAARMEDGIRKIKGVTAVSVNFIAKKLTLEADDETFDAVLKQALKVCRKIEPDCRLLTK